MPNDRSAAGTSRTIADYVVVGGGSAGLTAATRLAENPDVRGLVIEADGPDSWWNLLLHIPAAYALVTRYGSAVRHFPLEPQAHLNGRRFAWPRGEVLGGCSSVNAIVYVRGHPLDFDGWATTSGFANWGAATVLPAFRRMERYDESSKAQRGGTNPLHVARAEAEYDLDRAFLDAGQESGYPLARDFNDDDAEGFGCLDKTVGRGKRESAASAYRRLGYGRRDLVVRSRVRALELLFENRRCVGVLVQEGGEVRRLHATAEVVLTCGAIGSPQLLLWSGIGDADALRAVGITPRHHLPGVGHNLQDHLEIQVQHRSKGTNSLYGSTRPLGRLATTARWLLTRSGDGASNHFETAAFIRSDAAVPYPDLQLHFIKLATIPSGERTVRCHGYQIYAGPLRPASRGCIKLRSARREDPPIIDPRYMSEPRDWDDMRRCLALTREIMAQPAPARFSDGEIVPGAAVRTTAEIDAYVRETVTFGHHACGTCKMGQDPMAVVDGELRVHGIEGLRVADASIMPTITSGNTNEPSIMIGERVAELIRAGSTAPSRVVEPAAARVARRTDDATSLAGSRYLRSSDCLG